MCETPCIYTVYFQKASVLGNKIAQAIEEEMKYLRKSIHQIEAGRYQIHELTEAD